MSARIRRPTDDAATEIYDPDRRRAPVPVAASAPAPPDSFEQEVTEVTPIPSRQAVELATPTHVDAGPPGEPAAPLAGPRGLERSEPIRVISMKEQTVAAQRRNDDARVPLHVQLRSLAEVAGRNDTPVSLGRLAPPRDPRQARARRRRDNMIWACVAIALGGGISLAIWLVAGR
jgi:hypothetical protein